MIEIGTPSCSLRLVCPARQLNDLGKGTKGVIHETSDQEENLNIDLPKFF
jgi:hypothetical protein